MLRARLLACQALVAALASFACADSDATDGGDDGELGEPVPDHDAELRCGAAVAPALSAVGPILGDAALGPCGHLAYHDDEGQGWLIAPDGTRSEFEHASHVIEFAPTGDLMAWEQDLGGNLSLRDLVSGSERTIASDAVTDNFAFVPSFVDSQRGAWLWSCEQGVLERHDASDSELLAESVVCASVVGSTGSPRLGFADLDGRVWLADLDTGVLVGSEDLEFVGHDGSKRDDTLWIDHDGELVVHVAIEWQGEDDVDSEWPVELWARVLDRKGETVLDASSSLALRQAPRRGAPVFVFQQGEIVRFDAGAPSSVDADLDSSKVSESGELFLSTQSEQVLVLDRSPSVPVETIGQFSTPVELQPSPSGTALAIEHHSDICIVDEQGECNRILLALRTWSSESGLDERVLLSSSPWNLEATLDDGSMLVIGAPVEAEGPIYDGEQPVARALLIDREGEIQAELPAGNGDLAIRQVFTLADDRVLFEYQGESGVGDLLLAGADIGFVSLIAGVDVALLQTWVDARSQRVAFVAEQAGSGTLWYGGL
jgi:hypothetical protein